MEVVGVGRRGVVVRRPPAAVGDPAHPLGVEHHRNVGVPDQDFLAGVAAVAVGVDPMGEQVPPVAAPHLGSGDEAGRVDEAGGGVSVASLLAAPAAVLVEESGAVATVVPPGDLVAAVLVEGVVARVMRSSPCGVSTTTDSAPSGAGSPAPQAVRHTAGARTLTGPGRVVSPRKPPPAWLCVRPVRRRGVGGQCGVSLP